MPYYELKMKKKSKIGNKDEIAKLIGSKGVAVLYNIVSMGPRIILRSAFQLLRANVITRIMSVVFLIFVDSISLAMGRISRKQFVINLGLALMLLVGGTAGWYLGTAAINRILIESMVLGIIAGVIGAGILGGALSSLWEKVVGIFVQDDAHEMLRVLNDEFNEMLCEYNLDTGTAEQLKEEIEVEPKVLQNIFCSKAKKETCREVLCPYFEKYVVN